MTNQLVQLTEKIKSTPRENLSFRYQTMLSYTSGFEGEQERRMCIFQKFLSAWCFHYNMIMHMSRLWKKNVFFLSDAPFFCQVSISLMLTSKIMRKLKNLYYFFTSLCKNDVPCASNIHTNKFWLLWFVGRYIMAKSDSASLYICRQDSSNE